MYAVGEYDDSPVVAASRVGYVTVEIRGDGSVLARRPDGVYVDIQMTSNGPFASEIRSPTVLDAENAWRRGDHPTAIELYRHGAEQGDAQAMVVLGLLYAHGRRVEKNEREAVRWFAEAAKLGYADGQYRLGWMYARGNGLPKDLKRAEQLLRQAVQQNHAAAAYELGCLLLASAADAQQTAEAVAWVAKAAEAAHIKAQLQLAQLYAAGRGVPLDAGLAEHWRNQAIFNELLRAARKGDVERELDLARAYAAGKLIAADPQNAEWWYQRVIEKSGGLYRAITAYEELGELFQRHADLDKAKRYYTLAAEAGSATSRDKLKAMETAQALAQMSPIGRYKFHLAAKDWKGKIIALWSGAAVLPVVFVVSLIGLPIASALFESRMLTGLAMLGIGLSGLALAVMLLVTVYWLCVAALVQARASHAAIALAVVIVVTALAYYAIAPSSENQSAALTEVDQLHAQASRQFRQKDYAAAYASYGAIIEHDPGDKLAHLGRGNASLSRMQYDEALQDYNRAIEIDPRYADGYFARGTLHWLLGELDQAQADYFATIELAPDDSLFYAQLARVLFEQQAVEKVKSVYRLAYRQSPDRAWALDGWFGAMLELKQYDEILAAHDSLPAQGSDTVAADYYAGVAYMERQQYQAAIRVLEQAVENAPDQVNIEAYGYLARAYRETSNAERCETRLKDYAARTGREQRMEWCSEGGST